MLDALGHDTVVGRYHQHGKVDGTHAGEHVAHKALVAGHVDKTDGPAFYRPVSKTEVDGNAARALFGQPVGFNARERPNQRGFAVINVTGGSDEHGDRSDVRVRKNLGARSLPDGCQRLEFFVMVDDAAFRRRSGRKGQTPFHDVTHTF